MADGRLDGISDKNVHVERPFPNGRATETKAKLLRAKMRVAADRGEYRTAARAAA
jgi:hypothetical protein